MSVINPWIKAYYWFTWPTFSLQKMMENHLALTLTCILMDTQFLSYKGNGIE